MSNTKPEWVSPEEPKLPFPHQFDLDYETLHALADNKEQTWLADYIQGLEPTLSNEYTTRRCKLVEVSLCSAGSTPMYSATVSGS